MAYPLRSERRLSVGSSPTAGTIETMEGMVMSDVKFCKDCLFHRSHLSPVGTVHTCMHELAMIEQDIVSGEVFFHRCKDMRDGTCGRDATLFEKMEPYEPYHGH